MANKKDKTNYGFRVLLGILFVIFSFWNNKTDITEAELTTKTITVSHPIQIIHSNRSKLAYRFGSQQYACDFTISSFGDVAARGQGLENITAGDTLVIKIHDSRLNDLNNKSEDIPVYALERNSKQLYDLTGYNEVKQTYYKRLNMVMLVMGILLLLNGLTILSGTAAMVIAVLCVVVSLLLRWLNVWG